MTILSGDYPRASKTTPLAMLCLSVHALTILLSAFLLFSIQPMFTRMVLPRLGGSAAVWSIALVFFQGMLLLGYLYAHLLNRYCGARLALPVHLTVLATALICCPIALASGLGKPPETGQALWLIGLFSLSVGLPFFAVSTNGPLVQSWFARSGHPLAENPYFLYGASNLGSFAALILYPVLIEPTLTLRDQSLFWTFGYGLLIAAIAACGVFALRAGWVAPKQDAAARNLPIPLALRAEWTGLALIPSGLLVAVTAHISTDVATIPLLWIAPLALFLLTFVLAFQERPVLPYRLVAAALPVIALVTILVETFFRLNLWLMLGCNLTLLFLAAMQCHMRLFALRPAASRLTEFYLFISIGGVIGGILTSLVAPNVFSTVTEYPVLIAAALLALPATETTRRQRLVRAGLALAAVALVYTAALIARETLAVSRAAFTLAGFAGSGAVMLLERRKPIVVAAAAGSLLALLSAFQTGDAITARSFFGVKKIDLSSDGQFRQLSHGQTIHGGIRVKNADGSPSIDRPRPSTYYSFGSPMSDAIAAARAVAGGRLGAVAVAGLGTGSLACHAEAGEAWSFFEIDPQMVEIARDPRLFRYMRDCAPDAHVVIGDARLKLAEEAGPFDVILLDAFSSDAIPIHLITEEAVSLYRRKLAEHGLIVFHISNRYLDLAPFVNAIAERLGLMTLQRYQTLSELSEVQREDHASASSVIVLARHADDLASLKRLPGWSHEGSKQVRPWTDDYSNVLAALLQHHAR